MKRSDFSNRARLLLCGAPLAFLTLGGCANLPSSGPTGAQIVEQSRALSDLNARIVDLDANGIALANEGAVTGERPRALAAEGRVDQVGPGDALEISVFEVGSALFSQGGLMSGSIAARPTAAGSTLPLTLVGADGTIGVPYVGRLNVSGQSADTIARLIESRLKGLSQHAQVSVVVRENVTNSVFVLGTQKPGRVPLSLGRERLLDAVALTGGPVAKPETTTVRLTRGERSAEIEWQDLMAGSPDNVVLLPGDRIELLSPVRTFMVMGATNKVSEIPFEMQHMTLAQAIARAGGPAEAQADPAAVFVFRWGPPGTEAGPARPVIYRLNLMRAEAYLLSQQFAMRNGDVIYIAAAGSNQATKLAQIVNLLFSPFFSLRQVTR